MKKKKVWRYYCNYCGKGGCNGGHIKKHEKHCTKNPGRECGMCRLAGLGHQSPETIFTKMGLIGDNKLAYFYPKEVTEDFGSVLAAMHETDAECTRIINLIRQATSGCPACMLAVIRQFYPGYGFGWDYRKAADEWLNLIK